MKSNKSMKAMIAVILMITTLATMSSIVSAEFIESIFVEIDGTYNLTSSSGEDDEDDQIELHNCLDNIKEVKSYCSECCQWYISMYTCGKCDMSFGIPQPPRHVCNNN